VGVGGIAAEPVGGIAAEPVGGIAAEPVGGIAAEPVGGTAAGLVGGTAAALVDGTAGELAGIALTDDVPAAAALAGDRAAPGVGWSIYASRRSATVGLAIDRIRAVPQTLSHRCRPVGTGIRSRRHGVAVGLRNDMIWAFKA